MALERGKKMDDAQLSAFINQEVAAAQGSDTNKLSQQREKAMEYYYGKAYGNESDDKSQIVTREVLNTIEWIKPELIKIFASGSETVRFEPQTIEDVPEAQQATDYINYLFHRKNNGFKIIYQWLTDGLLQKNGVIKIWYDTDRSKSREEYQGRTDQEIQMLIMDEDVEVVEHSTEMVEGQQLTDIVIIRTGAAKGLKIDVIPPEEFIISRKATDIETSPFCAHRTRMTISDLNAMGFKNTKDLSGTETSSTINYADEYQARHDYDDTDREENEAVSSDPTMREVWVTEAYARLDFDGDGIAELRKIVTVGTTVLSNEEVEGMPFAGWTPIIISHKFHGLSLADLVMDLQRLQSQLLRNILDNQYLTNNGRYTAVEGMVNLDDLLTSRPHGVVRVKMADAVRRLDTPQLGATAFQMLDYMDSMVEKRTGVSERSQGLDQNQLNPNTSAMATNQVMTAAQQRIELIARVFGETGLTDAFRIMYREVITNETSSDIFRLRDEYVEVDPSTWRERKDVSVVVGLGNGSKETEMMQLGQLFQQQQQLSSNPATAQLVQPTNMYNLLEDQVKVFNKAHAGRYFSDPSSQEAQQAAQQQQQQQMQMMQQQEKLQAQQIQIQQGELQIKGMVATTNDQNAKTGLGIKQQKQDLDVKSQEEDMVVKTAELAMEASLEETQGRPVALG
jgi:hypothetical protein